MDRALTIEAAGRTITGPRTQNEDSLLCSPERGLFLVADGLGGRPCGKRASELLVQTLDERCQAPPSLDGLARAFLSANDLIFRESVARGLERPMATTGTAAWLDGDELLIGHVGDTRLLLLGTEGFGAQLTPDHTVDTGWTHTTETASRVSNQLTAAIGDRPREGPEDWIHLDRHPVAAGSLLLLMSDGVSDALPRGDIAAIAAACRTAEETAERILNAAKEVMDQTGTGDNATVIAVRLHHTPWWMPWIRSSRGTR